MALKYIGNGTYLHGVPARDLTDKEEEKYGALIAEQQEIAGRVLYEPVAPQQDAKSGRAPREERG